MENDMGVCQLAIDKYLQVIRTDGFMWAQSVQIYENAQSKISCL